MAPRSLFTAYAAPLLTRDQAKAIADKVLAFSKADETRVVISSQWSGNTRFAGGEITTSGGITDTTLNVISTIGKRRATVSSNVFDDAALQRTVDLRTAREARARRSRDHARARTAELFLRLELYRRDRGPRTRNTRGGCEARHSARWGGW